MAESLLLNQVFDEFGGDSLKRIASAVGERPAKVNAALGGVVPALMGGIADKAQTLSGVQELLGVIQRNQLDRPQYEHVADAIRERGAIGNLMQTGEALLETVLPNKTNAVTNWVVSHAGMSAASSRSLMALTLPLLLGLIGWRNLGCSATGLIGLIGEPSSHLSELPAGLASILGSGGAAASRQPLESGFRAQPWFPGWLWLLLTGLAIAALAAWILFPRSRGIVPSMTPAPVGAIVPTMPIGRATEKVDLGAFFDARLPNGAKLHIPKLGVENKLLSFILDPAEMPDSNTWFSFDRLEFGADAGTLKPTSNEQIKNVADIMNAFPDVKLKIGGYTDNRGDAGRNLKLSQDRADSAMRAIVRQGIDPSRLQAEGFGEQHPVADNATREGRRRNRRIDVTVTAK